MGADGGPHLFLCAGEASSDRIAADLMQAVRAAAPGARFSGIGGDRMVAAGLDQWYDLPRHSIMWAGQALRLLPALYREILRARARLARDPADAVVCVDNPGINFFFAKTARERGIPSIYYVGPQLWAYNPWRIAKVRRWVDRMLVILPFEEPYYRTRGVDATYVGHPLFAHLAAHPPDGALVADLRGGPAPADRAAPVTRAPLIGILPGSRTGEIVHTMPVLLRTAERLAGLLPDARFVVSVAKPKLEALVRRGLEASIVRPRVIAAGSGEIYAASDLVLAKSGTVTFESVWYGTPTVIVYRTGGLAWCMAQPWMGRTFIGLPNLLAGRRIVPEFYVARDRSREIADAAIGLLADPRLRGQCLADLAAMREEVGKVSDPSARAAAEVLRTIADGRSRVRATG